LIHEAVNNFGILAGIQLKLIAQFKALDFNLPLFIVQ
jgi:hypothetical protein